MDFSTIYRMSMVGKRTALHVEPACEIDDHLDLYRGERSPSTPIVFHFKKGASGSRAYDFVGTTYAVLRLVSDRVIEVLRPFTGWTTYPVEVYGKRGESIPGYHGLAVTGRCGPIDDTRSEPRICLPAVPEGRVSRQWFGYYFDPETWDGSDLFIPKNTGLTFVVEAVRTTMEKAGLTNVSFEALTDCRNGRVPAEFL